LCDIADLKGESCLGIEKLCFGKSPSKGGEKYITQQRVVNGIAANGFDLTEIRISGASKVKISKLSNGASIGLPKFTEVDKDVKIQAEKSHNVLDKADDVKTNVFKTMVTATVSKYFSNLAGDNNIKVDVTLLGCKDAGSGFDKAAKLQIDSAPRNLNSKAARLTISAFDNRGKLIGRCNPIFKISVLKSAIVALVPLSKGMVVDSSMVAKKYVDYRGRSALYTDYNTVVGKRVKRNVNAGSPIFMGSVEIPPLVFKGKAVQVVAHRGGIVVRQFALPMQEGGMGEIIMVKNTRSGQLYPVRVLADGKCELATPTNLR
jgi:flagella basal body P-ring formation protein FlgA